MENSNAIGQAASPTLFGRLRGSAAARDGAYVLAAQGVATLIALVADSLLFRELDVSERGVLTAALGFRTVMLYVADMGMTLTTIRIGSYYSAKGMRAEANSVFRRALVIRWVAALGLGALAIVFSEQITGRLLVTPGRPNLIYASVAALLGMTTVSWGVDVSQCRRRFKAYFAQYAGEALLRAAAIIVVLRGLEGQASRSSEIILWTMAAGVIVAAMISVIIERDAFADATGFGLSASAEVGSELRAFIPYAAAATLLGMVGVYTEVFLLKKLRGPADTAVFEGARRLGSLLPLLTAGVTAVMLPRASALESPAEILTYIRKSLKVMLPLAVFLSGALAISASFVIPLFCGDRYEASIPALRWICLAHALSFVATPLSFVLFPLKRPGTLVILNGLNLLLSIAIGIPMVSSHGVMGAAWSMLIVRVTMSIVTGIVLVLLVRELKREVVSAQ